MLSYRKQIIRLVVFYALAFVGVCFLSVLCYASMRDDICFDSTILLTEVERIAEGYVPYQTLHLNYPPLWFYLMVGLKLLFHVPYGCYNFYFAVNLLMLIACAFAVYKLSGALCGNKRISLTTSWLFLFLCMINGGLNVLFEVPSLMFGLFGLWFTVAYKEKSCYHYLWIGAVLACSFLVKQFGLGFAALSMLMVLVDRNGNEKTRKELFLLCGFSFVFLSSVFVFGGSFVESVFFNKYSSHLDVSAAERVHNMSHMLRSFVRRVPIILAAILLLPAVCSQGKWREALVLTCAICGFSLQFLFMVDASHYYMYLIPFAALVVPVLYSLDLTPSERLIVYVSCFFLLYVNIQPVANVTKIRIESNARKLQLSTELDVFAKMPEQSEVWIADTGALPLYYFADLLTPNMEKYGYCATKMQISEAMASDQVAAADFVICSNETGSSSNQDLYFTPSLRSYVTAHESKEVMYMGRKYLLYDLRKE